MLLLKNTSTLRLLSLLLLLLLVIIIPMRRNASGTHNIRMSVDIVWECSGNRSRKRLRENLLLMGRRWPW